MPCHWCGDRHLPKEPEHWCERAQRATVLLVGSGCDSLRLPARDEHAEVIIGGLHPGELSYGVYAGIDVIVERATQ